MSSPLDTLRDSDLEVLDLSVRFRTDRGLVHAVDHVDLSVPTGTAMALVGESGSGKSALVRSLLRLHDSHLTDISGHVSFGGRDLLALRPHEMRAVRGNEIALVPQDPLASLNPARTVEWHIRELLRVHGKPSGKPAARRRALELLDDVRLSGGTRTLRSRPHELSGGMRQRVLIALALACQPQLLIADEPTTALDVTVQRQILDLLATIRLEHSMSLLFVTHDLGVASIVSDHVTVMYAGTVVESAPSDTLFDDPRMPYTAGLLACAPDLDQASDHQLVPMVGGLPDPVHPPLGCRFAPRCEVRLDHCDTDAPPLLSAGASHLAACWRNE